MRVCCDRVEVPEAVYVPCGFLHMCFYNSIIVCSGSPVRGLFKRLVFWGNQWHRKGETALLSDITSSLFWWPKWPLDKGSLSLTLPCSILSLRGTDEVMGWLSTWTSDTNTEWHYTITAIALALNKDTWNMTSRTQVMTHFWLLMTTASKQHKALAMKSLDLLNNMLRVYFPVNVISQKPYKSEPRRAVNQLPCEGH